MSMQGVGICNTPDVTFHICNSNSCHFRLCVMIFPPWSGFVFRFAFCSCRAFHIMSSCALMHPSFFPVVRFAFRRSVFLRWSFLPFFLVWGLNISGLDRDLPCGLGLLPVDHLSSFVPFGLRLILQWLTEGPKRPRVCVAAQHPSKLAQNPPKPSPSSRAFNHDRVIERPR